jgi:hypothetical protein
VTDHINHPHHYTASKSGIEAIQITEHMSFCLGNAIKYLWRQGLKGPAIDDLRKADRYLDFEVKRVLRGNGCVMGLSSAHRPALVAFMDGEPQTDMTLAIYKIATAVSVDDLLSVRAMVAREIAKASARQGVLNG